MTQTAATSMIVTGSPSKMASAGTQAGPREASPYGCNPSQAQSARRVLPKTPANPRLSQPASVTTEPSHPRMTPIGQDSPKGHRSDRTSPGVRSKVISDKVAATSPSPLTAAVTPHRNSAFHLPERTVYYKCPGSGKVPVETQRVVSPGADQVPAPVDDTRLSPQGARRILTGTMETISNMILSRSGYTPKPCCTDTNVTKPKPKQNVASLTTRSTHMSMITSPSPAKRNSPNSNAVTHASTKPVASLCSNKGAESLSSSGFETKNEAKGHDLPDVKPLTKTNVLDSEVETSKTAQLTKSNIITSQVDSIMLMSLAGSAMSPAGSMMCLSNAKEYIMDKYFEEMAKSWNTPDNASTDGPPDVSIAATHYSSSCHQVEPPSHMMCGCGQERRGVAEEESVSVQDNCSSGSCSHTKHDIRNSYSSSNLKMYTQLEDLIHLSEPLTEEAVIKTLQARFYNGHYYTRIGPILVLVNPLTAVPEPSPLGLKVAPPRGHLQQAVEEASRQQLETGHSQTLILNGVSGSGKSRTSMLLLRQLFDVAGGGPETDAFKHLQAAFTVLRSLGSAATSENSHSSRMGYLIENNLSDGAIYRTRIHCYFIDQSRVVKPQPTEKNFHVFYQMLAGLTSEERGRYHLAGSNTHTLTYLSAGDVTQDALQDRQHFLTWKSALAVLGIPFADIMRVLSAILLLGNVEFVEGAGLELDVCGNGELKSVAALLGVSAVCLYRGLSTRTRRARGQIFKALADPASANTVRDGLAKALYSRTVAAIIKRANNTKRLIMTSANSSDSNDSGHHEAAPETPPSPGRPGGPHTSAFSLQASHTDSFIGILDMFGFEELRENRFEQLCVNLCAETLQHFYNTHMFRAAEEACAEEAISADIDVTYTDNAPTIELLSSPRVGLLSLLDAECGLQRGTPDTFLQKVHIQHSRNRLFYEPMSHKKHTFAIKHYCGPVMYEASDLLNANKNQLTDDVISVFTKQNCNFGFASHLFSPEIRAIQEDGGGPKGTMFRISPSPMSERQSDLKGTLSSDFHAKLDSVLQLLVMSKPHFIRCIKSNDSHQRELFERDCVKKQVRSLQLLETLHLMAAGFPHRLRYRVFNSYYKVLVPQNTAKVEKPYEQSKLILDELLHRLDESKVPAANAQWALGKKHIFLSEGCRQLLEELRDRKRHLSATIIQSRWRGRQCLKKWSTLKRQLMLRNRERQPIRRHIRRNSLLEGVALKKHEATPLQRTYNQYGLDGTSANGGQSQNPYGLLNGQAPRKNHGPYGSHGSLYGGTSPSVPAGSYPSHGPPTASPGQPGGAVTIGHRSRSNSYGSKPKNLFNTSNISNSSQNEHHSKSQSIYGRHRVSQNNNNNGPRTKVVKSQIVNGVSRSGVNSPPVTRAEVVGGGPGSHSAGSRASTGSGGEGTGQPFVPNDHPPPVPASRMYTVKGNVKVGYPQIRVMKQNYQDYATGELLVKGQEMKVVGLCNKKGYLQVEHGANILQVPYQLTDIHVQTVQVSRRGSASSHLPGVDV